MTDSVRVVVGVGVDVGVADIVLLGVRELDAVLLGVGVSVEVAVLEGVLLGVAD